jgi:hypothetical protein
MLFLLAINYLIRSGKLKFLQAFIKPHIQYITAKFGKTAVILFIACNYYSLDTAAGEKKTRSKQDVFPVPKGIENQLFYLQRDPDANTIIYQLNTKNGVLDNKKPVDVFWIRYAEDGEIKGLSVIQRNLAYGINSKQINKDKHELKLVSYPDFPLYLIKSKQEQQYHVYFNLNDQEVILDKVFVRIDGGTFYYPNVLYIELKGKSSQTGENLTHRIYL